MFTDLARVAADAPVMHVGHGQVSTNVAVVHRLENGVKRKTSFMANNVHYMEQKAYYPGAQQLRARSSSKVSKRIWILLHRVKTKKEFIIEIMPEACKCDLNGKYSPS